MTLQEELNYNTSKNKRTYIHVVFWIVYYALFSMIWMKDGNYKASFYLEFILLPVRIFSVYFTALYLLPEFLLKKKIVKFLVYYFILIVSAGVIQRFFLHFFWDNYAYFEFVKIFDFRLILRSVILINTTVLLVSSCYVLWYYYEEKEKNNIVSEKVMLKSNKRTYNVDEGQIEHIEALGNYVTYYLSDNSKIIVYGSLKESVLKLSENFVRIHKSYVINKKNIKSFSKENVEMNSGIIIPIGKSANIEQLTILNS
ncbi:MAG: LytTR family transcriptional regulator [Flavobacteriaceae bacterium]